MHRRLVSLLLLPCLMLTQSASLGHSHGGNEPPGHDLRPHFHVTPHSERRCHGPRHHHHGPGGHHHHHHNDGDDTAAPDAPPRPRLESLPNHDADAIYISRVDVVITERSAVAEELATSSPLPADSHPVLTFWTYPPHEAVSWTRPPPPSGRVCALY